MDKWDLIALAGLAMVGVGLYFVYWPLSLIVPGAGLVVLGVMGARNSKSKPPEHRNGDREMVH